MNQTIRIKNSADSTIIDIEGTIGLSEEWQFENAENRVATYERFRESVAHIADISNANIRVNIRSTGGDVNDALLIYEALRATGAHVTTCCYGYTASAATIVAQAASEGCRYVAPSSLYLIHNSLCSTEGNAEELQAEVDMLRQTDARIAEIYASRSGREVEHIKDLMAVNGGRGRWLSPEEAIAEGLVDAIDPDIASRSEGSIVERAKRGVSALIKAIGLGVDEESLPSDINYVSREEVAPIDAVPKTAVAEQSVLLFDEGQKRNSPTTLKEVEDPLLFDVAVSSRHHAYESDARSLRNYNK